MDGDPCPRLDDASREGDQAQPQGVGLGDAFVGALRQGDARCPEKPVGSGVREQPKLIGEGPDAAGGFDGQVGYPALDMTFGRAAPTADLCVERLGSVGEIGDDDARVGPLVPCLHSGDEAFRSARSGGAVMETREAPHLVGAAPSVSHGSFDRGRTVAEGRLPRRRVTAPLPAGARCLRRDCPHPGLLGCPGSPVRASRDGDGRRGPTPSDDGRTNQACVASAVIT